MEPSNSKAAYGCLILVLIIIGIALTSNDNNWGYLLVMYQIRGYDFKESYPFDF